MSSSLSSLSSLSAFLPAVELKTRDDLKQWEEGLAKRSYWWVVLGKAVVLAVWAQALGVELARATGREAASLLVDLRKAYELVTREGKIDEDDKKSDLVNRCPQAPANSCSGD